MSTATIKSVLRPQKVSLSSKLFQLVFVEDVWITMDSIYFKKTTGESMQISPEYTSKISFNYAELAPKYIDLSNFSALLVQDKVALFVGSMIITWNFANAHILHDKF